MADTASKIGTVVFADWSGGELGNRGAWSAPDGVFDGLNVVRYADGSIGPRAGLKDLPVTGLPATGLSGLGAASDGTQKIVWVIQGTGVRDFPLTAGGASVSYTTALASTPTFPVQGVIFDSKTYIASRGDKIYKLDHAAKTVTAIAGSPGGWPIVRYGDRVLTAVGNRVYFSDAGDPTSWPALNYFDVGDPGLAGVTAMLVQRGTLMIAKYSPRLPGLAEWWALTGVPGYDATLRQIAAGAAAGEPDNAVATQAGDVAFVSPGTAIPAVFTGGTVELARHLFIAGWVLSNRIPAFKAVGLRDGDDWFVISTAGPELLLRREGVWTQHQLSAVGLLPAAWVAADVADDVYVMAEDNGPSVAPTFNTWKAYLDRPAFVGDTHVAPCTAIVQVGVVPEWWEPSGGEVAVRHVIVDFRTWNTGDTVANKLVCNLTPLRLYEAGEGPVQQSTFTEDPAVSPVGGKDRRHKFSFNFGMGNGFRIKFTSLRGVAIQKVTVVIATRPIQA